MSGDGVTMKKQCKSSLSRKTSDVHSNRTQSKRMAEPIMSDIKSQKSSSSRRRKLRLKKIKSRELYAGAVYIDCDCYHHNGLQHDCPRTLCGGKPCTVYPRPRCDLGIHFMKKWEKYYDKLDEVPPISFCGSIQDWVAEVSKKRFQVRMLQAEK